MPSSAAIPGSHWESFSTLVLQFLELLLGLSRGGCTVDRLQIAGHLLTRFPGHIVQRSPHQMHDAEPHLSARIHRCDRFRKSTRN